MSKRIIPLLTVFVIGGLIVSCSTSSPLIKEAQTSIKNQQYDSTLAKANRYIQKYPGKPLGYFYKGEALGLKGNSIDISRPKKARPLYLKMDKAFTKATEIADTMSNPPEILQRIGPVRTSIWRSEHNAGIKFVSSDSLNNTVPNPLEVSIAHLKNATIAQPDCAITWNALAQVSAMKQKYKQATKAQRRYLSLKDSATVRSHLLLAQWLNRSDRSHKALSVLKHTRQKYPNSLKASAMLADTYSKLGKADKSISVVQQLVKRNPSNGRYRMSLGTQIYQKAIDLQHKFDSNIDKIISLETKKMSASGDQADKLQQKIDKLRAKNESLLNRIHKLTGRALKQLHAPLIMAKMAEKFIIHWELFIKTKLRSFSKSVMQL